MSQYTFLHNFDLKEQFNLDEFSKNSIMMHNYIKLHEKNILDLIQIAFVRIPTQESRLRYKIAPDYSMSSKTWSMYGLDSNWNRESIKKGAQFLSNHLDYLPKFMIDTSYAIMGECLGYAVVDRAFSLPKNEIEYKEFLELGKSHIAIFMMLIEELGKIGIDCRAIKINANSFYVGSTVSKCFEGKSNIYDIKQIFEINYPRNYMNIQEDIIKNAFGFNTDIMYRELLFSDLEEFFSKILQIIERICTFRREMIDPDTLDFTKYYYLNDALPNSYNLPNGNFVDAEDCIKKFLYKLKKGEFIEAYYKGKEKVNLEKLKNILTINGPLKDSKIKIKRDKQMEQLTKRIDILEDRQDKIEEKMNILNDEFTDLKTQILNYLETGKNKPDLSKANSNEVVEIIKNAPTKTTGANIRKNLLLITLVLTMCSPLKSDIHEEQLNSAVPTDTSAVIDVETSVGNEKETENEEDVEKITEIQESKPLPEVNMHILEENNGKRDYYSSIYDKNRKGVTEQYGVIIRYFAFQNDELIADFGKEDELQEFLAYNDADDYVWKIAVCCLDPSILYKYTNEEKTDIPLQYTTFFTDYTPNLKESNKLEIKKQERK